MNLNEIIKGIVRLLQLDKLEISRESYLCAFVCDQQKNLRCIAELIRNISLSLTLLLTRDICQIIAKVSFNYSKF